MSILEHLESIYRNVGDFRIPYQTMKVYYPRLRTKLIKILNNQSELFINYRNVNIPNCPLVNLQPQIVVLGEKRSLSPQDIIGLYPVDFLGAFNPEMMRALFIPDQKKSKEIAKRVIKSLRNRVSDYTILRIYPDKFQFRFTINPNSSLTGIDKLNLTSEFMDEYSNGRFEIIGLKESPFWNMVVIQIYSELVRYKISWEDQIPW